MPTFRQGDLFSATGFIIVTANSFLTSECKLVMGKGAANELKRKIPGIDRIFAQMILDACGHLGRYGLLFHERFGIAQVKRRFNEKADVSLIRFSMEMLKAEAEKNPTHHYNINFPGIGNGCLSKFEVSPLLTGLPGNVSIWEHPQRIPWIEKVEAIRINPSSAAVWEVSRLAAEYLKARKALSDISTMRYKSGGETEEAAMARQALEALDAQ